MKVIGKMIKEKEKEYFIGKMEINMKVIGKMVSKKEKEYCIIKMEQKKKVNGKIINQYINNSLNLYNYKLIHKIFNTKKFIILLLNFINKII